jgi:hypothetical protein
MHNTTSATLLQMAGYGQDGLATKMFEPICTEPRQLSVLIYMSNCDS